MSAPTTSPKNNPSEGPLTDFVFPSKAVKPLLSAMVNQQRLLQYVFNVLMYHKVLKWSAETGAYFADTIDPYQITDARWVYMCEQFDAAHPAIKPKNT